MAILECVRLVAVLSTGIAAGAMAGHALLLGRFFNWVFASDRADIFRLTYPVFMQAKQPQRFFDNLFTLALLMVTAYDVLLWWTDRINPLHLTAGALQWAFVLIFFGTGFATLESELLARGDISPQRVHRFLSLNTAMTGLSAILLLASFACLVIK